MDDTRITRIEEQLAHLTRMVEDLSDVVAAQDQQVKTLTKRVALLMEREAEREVSAGGSAVIADSPPPHY